MSLVIYAQKIRIWTHGLILFGLIGKPGLPIFGVNLLRGGLLIKKVARGRLMGKVLSRKGPRKGKKGGLDWLGFCIILPIGYFLKIGLKIIPGGKRRLYFLQIVFLRPQTPMTAVLLGGRTNKTRNIGLYLTFSFISNPHGLTQGFPQGKGLLGRGTFLFKRRN